ncbi:hypothetical protein Droror1_Dr00006081, partial [Drosera rotundifolia]
PHAGQRSHAKHQLSFLSRQTLEQRILYIGPSTSPVPFIKPGRSCSPHWAGHEPNPLHQAGQHSFAYWANLLH